MTRTRSEILVTQPYPPHELAVHHDGEYVKVEFRRASGLAALAGRRIWVLIPRRLMAELLKVMTFPPGLAAAKAQVVRFLERDVSQDGQLTAKIALLRTSGNAERLYKNASREQQAAFAGHIIGTDPHGAYAALREITGKE